MVWSRTAVSSCGSLATEVVPSMSTSSAEGDVGSVVPQSVVTDPERSRDVLGTGFDQCVRFAKLWSRMAKNVVSSDRASCPACGRDTS